MADKLSAELRTEFGKGAARRIRANGKIPAVIYGHGTEPQHVTLPGHEVMLIIRRANAILDLDIAGRSELALVKDVQKDPVRQIIEHLDLIIVRKGEKVTVDVAVHVEGEPAGDSIYTQENTTISVETEATHIPQSFTVSVEGLEEGTQILAKDVELPSGVELLTDPDSMVVNVTAPQLVDLGEDDDTAAEGDIVESDESGEDAPRSDEGDN